MKNYSILIACAVFLFSACQKAEKKDCTKYVNPFIGAAEYGHCFPGACVPFGLIQVGSETGNGGWENCSGYQSTDSTINGFTQTRLNGTGCPDLGDLLMLPFTGEKTDGSTSKHNHFERPFVLIEDGVPTHLFAATVTGPKAWQFQQTWNMVVPLLKQVRN